jgi:hypothetical protein
VLVYLAGQTLLDDGNGEDEIAYSEAKALVEDRPRTVRNVVFHPRPKKLEIELTSGRKLEARYPSDASALQFEELLDAQGIRYESRGSGDSAWWSILTYLLPSSSSSGSGSSSCSGFKERAGTAEKVIRRARPAAKLATRARTPTRTGKPTAGCYG